MKTEASSSGMKTEASSSGLRRRPLGEDEAKRDVRARVPESRGEKRTDEQNDGRDSRQVRFKVPDKQGEKRVVEDAARDKRPEKASKVDKSDGNEKGRDDRPHSVGYIGNYYSFGDAKSSKQKKSQKRFALDRLTST